MTTPDLVSFVQARIAEDEAAARATAENYPPPWRGREVDDEGDSIETNVVFDTSHRTVVWWESGSREAMDRLGEHIAGHDPARVLADCAAKRAIVEQYRRAVANQEFGRSHVVLALAAVLMQLAQPYAGHPDFAPSWAVAD